SRTRGVLEDEAILKSTATQQPNRLLEFLIRLGREPDDEIARDRDIGHVIPRPADEIFVLLRGVAAVHELKDAIASVLRGDMQEPADARTVAHDLQRLVGKIAREAGDETQTRKLGDGFVNLVEQLRERGYPPVAVIVGVMIDCLPEERHFPRARV